MYLPDYEDAIADYLTNSGEDYHNWDVTGAAWEMREKFHGIDLIFNDISVYLCMSGRQTAHTIERQAVTANPREKGNEMNDRLKESIREFNRRAEMAKRDGYTVAEGYVWEGWGNPTGPCARKVCKVEDYEQGR